MKPNIYYCTHKSKTITLWTKTIRVKKHSAQQELCGVISQYEMIKYFTRSIFEENSKPNDLKFYLIPLYKKKLILIKNKQFIIIIKKINYE
jgi:hypothetical protein